MKWVKWPRHCDAVLGFYSFSGDMSEGGSSVSGLDHDWLWVTEATKSKTVDKGGVLLYFLIIFVLASLSAIGNIWIFSGGRI